MIKYIKLPPIHSFTIETSLREKEVFQVLRDNIEPKKYLRWGRDHKTFEGSVGGNTFKINRIIHYQNSFLPRVTGAIAPTARGCRINIKMRPVAFVLAFMLAWFSVLVIGWLTAFFMLFENPRDAALQLAICSAFTVFGIALMGGGFGFEANKQQTMLTDMFKR